MLGYFIVFTITPGLIVPASMNLILIIIAVKLLLDKNGEKLTFRRFKQNFLKSWIFSTIATVSGGLALILFSLIFSQAFWTPYPKTQLQEIAFSISRAELGATYYDKWSFLFVLSGVVFSVVATLLFHFFYSSKKFFKAKWKRLIFSVLMAILTMPYYYLLPQV